MFKKIFCSFFVVFLLVSCEDQNPIPYVKVNFTVPINANNLIHVGKYEYFTGGLCGTFVYRLDMSTFLAYDRACPYDWQDDGYIIYDPALLQLICAKCGSAFNVLDGFPMNNTKSNYFLRPYKAILIDDMMLRVYN